MWQLHRDPRRRAQYHCVFAFIGFFCFCKKTIQKGKFLKKDVSARAKISRMQSHSPKRLLPSTRVYIMRTFYSSYTLEYRVSTRTIRGSLTGGTVRHTHSSSEFSLHAGEAWQQPTQGSAVRTRPHRPRSSTCGHMRNTLHFPARACSVSRMGS